MALFPLDPSERDSQGCARLCAGGTPALPGGLHPNETVTPRGQKRRRTLVPLVVEGGPSVFVFIRVHSWFSFINEFIKHRLFFLE